MTLDQEVQRKASQLVGWQPRIAHGAPEGRSATNQKFGRRAIFKELTVSSNLHRHDDSCRLSIAGHNPHWVQVNISTQGPIYTVEIIDVRGNYIAFTNGTVVWTSWNHSAKDLRNLLEFVQTYPDTHVEYREQGSLLAVEGHGQRRAYSLTTKPHGTCSTNPLHRDGFTASLETIHDPGFQAWLAGIADEYGTGNTIEFPSLPSEP